MEEIPAVLKKSLFICILQVRAGLSCAAALMRFFLLVLILTLFVGDAAAMRAGKAIRAGVSTGLPLTCRWEGIRTHTCLSCGFRDSRA